MKKCEWKGCTKESSCEADFQMSDKKTGEVKDNQLVRLCEDHRDELLRGIAPDIEEVEVETTDGEKLKLVKKDKSNAEGGGGLNYQVCPKCGSHRERNHIEKIIYLKNKSERFAKEAVKKFELGATSSEGTPHNADGDES